jgi:iron complex outermembrane receptor protein
VSYHLYLYPAQSLHSSSINEDDFNNHPEKPRNWAQAQGYESYDKLIMGVGYRQQLSQMEL